MSILTPFTCAFTGICRSPKAVGVLSALIVASTAFGPAALIAVLLLTPALIEAILNGPHTVASAFRASTHRIGCFILWVIGSTFGILVVTAVAAAVLAVVNITEWNTGPGLAVFILVAVLIPFATIMLAHLLATAAAAGLPSPIRVLQRKLFSHGGWTVFGTLALMWTINIVITVTAIFVGLGYSAKSGVGDGSTISEWAYNWSSEIPSGAFWIATILLVIAAFAMALVVTPAVVASTLGAPVGRKD